MLEIVTAIFTGFACVLLVGIAAVAMLTGIEAFRTAQRRSRAGAGADEVLADRIDGGYCFFITAMCAGAIWLLF